MAGAGAACSVGGGGASGPITNLGAVGPSPTAASQSSSRSKMSIALHIPAASLNAAAAVRATARTAASTRFGSIRHPNLISTASNGLSIQGEMNGAASGPEYDFDISGTSASCVSDGAGGRNCTFSIVENVGTYSFVISTYASTPTAPTNSLGGLTSLDSTTTTTYDFIAGQTITISATLGGTVSSIKLSVPQSINSYVYPQTVSVGIVAFDAAGEIIISSAQYSTPITLAATSSDPNTTATLSITSPGGATSSSQSNYPGDIIKLTYAVSSGSPAIGLNIAISASAGGNTGVTANLTPLFISDSNNVLAATSYNGAPIDTIVEPNGNTTDTITLTEGSGQSAFLRNFTITEDPLDTCANNEPFTYTYNGGNPTAVPPASVTPTGGAASFTLDIGGQTTSGIGCVYDVADGTGTVIPVSFQTSFTGTGNGNYNANVPAGLLYISAFSGTNNLANAAANPGGVGTPSNASLVMVAPTAAPVGQATSAPAGLYQIADANLSEPLGIAHDTAGDVFVADAGTATVNEYPPTAIGAYPNAAATAAGYYTYPVPSASSQPISSPDGLAYNAKTNVLYVSDYNSGYIFAIQEPYPAGSVPQARHRSAHPVTAARTPTFASGFRPVGVRRFFSGTGTTAATIIAILNVGGNPAGLAFDSSDNLYVAFPNLGVVQKYASVDGDTGGGTFTLAPTATIGGSGSGLVTPAEVTIGTDGSIFVQDAGAANVVVFNPANITTGTAIPVPATQDGFALIPSSSTSDTVLGLGFVPAGNTTVLDLYPGGSSGTPYTAVGTSNAQFANSANQYLPFATY